MTLHEYTNDVYHEIRIILLLSYILPKLISQGSHLIVKILSKVYVTSHSQSSQGYSGYKFLIFKKIMRFTLSVQLTGQYVYHFGHMKKRPS